MALEMDFKEYIDIANSISDRINDLKFDYIGVNSYTRHLADDVFTIGYTGYNSELKRKEHVEVYINYGYAGEDSFYVFRDWSEWENEIKPGERISSL